MPSHDWFHIEHFPNGITMLAEPAHKPYVMSYLVEGQRTVAVLDTGLGVGDFAGLVGRLSEREPIVLHSHAHPDHIGASAHFTRVLVHPSEEPALRAGIPNADFRASLANLVDEQHAPEGFDLDSIAIQGCTPTGYLHPGDRIDLGGRVLEIFHTPGHSPGGITLLDREARALFPGDAVYAGRMWAHFPDSDPAAYRTTLRLLAELARDVDAIYPSHRRVPLTPDDIQAMHAAYEAIWSGHPPDEHLPAHSFHPACDVYRFGEFQFWLPADFDPQRHL